jgi:hypothetical protein
MTPRDFAFIDDVALSRTLDADTFGESCTPPSLAALSTTVPALFALQHVLVARAALVEA